MAQREFFPCYFSYFEPYKDWPDEELGRLFRAVMKYGLTGERQELAGRESIAFNLIAEAIDRAREDELDGYPDRT